MWFISGKIASGLFMTQLVYVELKKTDNESYRN